MLGRTYQTGSLSVD